MWKTVPGGKTLRQQVLEEFASVATIGRCLQGAAAAGKPRVVRLVVIPKRERGQRRIVA